MKILVWGLGYVGTVSAACFARLGHEVIGIDTNLAKVDAINNGVSLVKEPGLQALVQQAVGTGQLRATSSGQDLVADADMSLICVGTPSGADGNTELLYVSSVAQEIGKGMQNSSGYHVVVLRSTVFPGTTRNHLCQLLEVASGKTVGQDFGLVMNPEFLREGSAVHDFDTPAYTIIGEFDSRSGEVVSQLYDKVDAPINHVTLEEAEFLKITNNVFHALKVGFANEIGRLCDPLEIDSHRLMELVCADTKLNISPTYLRPGFAFGGSCLPKDLRFVNYNARRLGVQVPILDSILPSNEAQVSAVRVKLHKLGVKKVGILGLSFKAGTDDLRESPVITLIRYLWQDGLDVVVYDPDVNPDEMLGANLEYLERQLPQIRGILAPSLDDMAQECEAVVLTQKRPEFLNVLQKWHEQLVVLDLVRLSSHPENLKFEKYVGISW